MIYLYLRPHYPLHMSSDMLASVKSDVNTVSDSLGR